MPHRKGCFTSGDPRLIGYANNARKFIDREKQKAAVRKVGLANVANGHLKRITTPEVCSMGGKAGLIANFTFEERSFLGKRAGKIGGKVQGRENARIGWMQHIALIRYEKSHADCKYCKKFSPHHSSE